MIIEHKISRLICIFESQILLAKAKVDSYYFLPGGHIEESESPDQTAIREVKEELGIDLSAQNIKFIREFENSWTNKNGKNHEICNIYLYHPDHKFETISQEDHLEFFWMPITELNRIDLRPGKVLEIIENI